MIDILLLPCLGGILVALIAGPLGSFTVWRGMAYFGDTLAHSALLGVALAVIFELNVQFGILLCCLGLAVLLNLFQKQSRLSTDSILGILSHSSLAIGLLAIGLLPGQRVDLLSYLFGDLLVIDMKDLLAIFILSTLALFMLVKLWSSFLMISIDEDLARAEGHKVDRLRLILMLLLAMLVAIAMKTVGILLITALLIIPAASAQRISRSPEAMALIASILGVFAVFGGIGISAFYDTATGPSIVFVSTCCFLMSFIYARLSNR